MEATVNELLVLKNTLQTRKAEVQSLLRLCVARRVNEVRYEEEVRKTIDESRYDPNDLEIRNTELSTALFELDRAIKVANAKTVVNVENVDIATLLAPVKPRPWVETQE